jgi:hypothetical protein
LQLKQETRVEATDYFQKGARTERIVIDQIGNTNKAKRSILRPELLKETSAEA